MASQQPPSTSGGQAASNPRVAFPQPDLSERQNSAPANVENTTKKKRKHKGGKKKARPFHIASLMFESWTNSRYLQRNRRQSFAAPPDDTDTAGMEDDRPGLPDAPNPPSAARDSFYRLQTGNRSNESLDSQALLDHRYWTDHIDSGFISAAPPNTTDRDHGPLQARRQSIQQGLISSRGSQHSISRLRTSTFPYQSVDPSRSSRLSRVQQAEGEDDGLDILDDRTPLMGTSYGGKAGTPRGLSGYGGAISIGSPGGGRFGSLFRKPSGASSRSSRNRGLKRTKSYQDEDDYDVNNPPSVPSSPKLGPDLHYDDVMLTSDEAEHGRPPEQKRSGDTLIDIDNDRDRSRSVSPLDEERPLNRRLTLKAEDDVCFPQEGLSEIAEEDFRRRSEGAASSRFRRRSRRKWPELSFLEEWAVEEKEQRTMEGIRARQVSEPLMIGGRLRPTKTAWHPQEDENPFRFTYFNEEFESTIHSQSISELLQPGQTWKTLFIPDPPVLSDSSSDEDDTLPLPDDTSDRKSAIRSPTSAHTPPGNGSTIPSRISSDLKSNETQKQTTSGQSTPFQQPEKAEKPKRYGPRPVFWLDVLCPTDAEMKVLSKTFGIHPLTAEDIMMEEAREKVELFRSYYFVNYRSFEQDSNSANYLEPVNVYVVVFREGVISFHFSQTPHPANVRRRIRQLSDYLFLTTDWISYAIIDDVTDAYAPLIERIEEEVDEIDEAILTLHADGEGSSQEESKWKRWRENFLEYDRKSEDGRSEKQDRTTGESGGDMLRRTGETRKKVMSLYRLLGNKADVIKGFAKRCNEQWEIAPRNEIGLYLGDIQDHIVTMTGNLSHYEK